MRAAVVTGFDQPIEVTQVLVPEPAAGQLRIRIEASELCHTDIHRDAPHPA